MVFVKIVFIVWVVVVMKVDGMKLVVIVFFYDVFGVCDEEYGLVLNVVY